jgi:glucokinase
MWQYRNDLSREVSPAMILAGDIGGTKCNLGVFEIRDGALRPLRRERLPSRSFSSAEEAIRTFLQSGAEKITIAVLAIAGPVVSNRVQVTNLPWVVDAAALSKVLGIPRVRLLNDLEATAYALGILPPSDFVTLREGVNDPQGNRALLAAGTGLGEALIIYDGRGERDREGGGSFAISATEGGHCDFAPRNDREIDLLRYLKQRLGIVSVEVILSGRGFRELHTFLNPKVSHADFNDPEIDVAPEITRQALAGTCPVCVEAVRLWVEIYGSEAGNLALKAMARGGVFIAGGIAVKILPLLLEGNRFVETFNAKEKMHDLLSRIPLRVVANEEAPLWGAAHVASRDYI